jgi:multidrug efflux pump subunit AcrB
MSAIGAGLPHGIEMVKVADQSAVVSGAVSGFVRVLVEAVLIVLAVSFVSWD